MSREYTTTSRMMMAITEHQNVRVVVRRDAVTRPPSTPYSPSYPIDGSGDSLPPPTQSAMGQSYIGSRQTDPIQARRREEHPLRLLPTACVSRHSHIHPRSFSNTSSARRPPPHASHPPPKYTSVTEIGSDRQPWIQIQWGP